jgi:hypothetical protein
VGPGPSTGLSSGEKITLVIDDTRFVVNTSLFTAHPDTMLGEPILFRFLFTFVSEQLEGIIY